MALLLHACLMECLLAWPTRSATSDLYRWLMQLQLVKEMKMEEPKSSHETPIGTSSTERRPRWTPSQLLLRQTERRPPPIPSPPAETAALLQLGTATRSIGKPQAKLALCTTKSSQWNTRTPQILQLLCLQLMQAGNITSFGNTFSTLPRPRTDAHTSQKGKATRVR